MCLNDTSKNLETRVSTLGRFRQVRRLVVYWLHCRYREAGRSALHATVTLVLVPFSQANNAMSTDAVSTDQFKQAMGLFPSGVTIVTTSVNEERFGFTASAFSSLSLSPPLILVCLANSADCFKPFNTGKQFAVNIIDEKYEELAMKFATKGCDKFAGDEFIEGGIGLPVLPGTPVSLECRTKHVYPGGDHVILIGEVEHLTLGTGLPTVWHAGGFRKLES